MSGTYKGYVLDGIGKVKLNEYPIPEPEADQVIIKNRYAGICGGDIASFRLGGADNMMPDGVEFGHEMVADVVAVGADVKDIHVGDRVYPYPTLVKSDPMRASCIGGFSEYVTVEKAALNHNLYLVPEEISDVKAAIIEPLTIGFRAVNQMNPNPEENAIVYGGGPIGVAAAIRLTEIGCPKVAIVEWSRYRCEKIEALGIKAICNQDEDWKQQVIDFFGPYFGPNGPAPQLGFIVDAAGNPKLFKDIQSLCPFLARISLVAIYHQLAEVDLRAFTFGVLSLQGTGGYTPEEVQQAMDVLKSDRWDVENYYVTHILPHDQFPEAMQLACDSSKSLKVIIKY